MLGLSKIALLAALVAPLVGAAPAKHAVSAVGSAASSAVHPVGTGSGVTGSNSSSNPQVAASSFWMANVKHQGTVAFGGSDFKVFRNVQDYGAKGDGSTDDTDAINQAITDGNRCGQGCDSTTVTPAIVYFPPGTYVVSKPIVQLYYTQLIGDATNLPTLKAAAGFAGMAVIDADPYADGGANWYTNQNNFFRQIRNFVIDLTGMPATAGAGIHWQVAQATSLQNIVFNMIKGGDDNKQQGIFMDNGSGGWMTDLVFNGGKFGAFFGNQQFTTRNLTFNDCQTAVYMNWNWLWTLKSLTINNCQVGLDISSPGNGGPQTVGSVVLQDSVLTNTPTGVKTAFANGQDTSNGTLIIDNVDFSGSQNAVVDLSGKTILAGGGKVASWGQGHAYGVSGASKAKRADMSNIQGNLNAPNKPSALLTNGKFAERSKPQYEGVDASSFLSVKDAGAKGDGTTDDTKAVQDVINQSASSGKIAYFDHGAYLITDTVKVPAKAKIVGEIWPLIMADGSSFGDESNPKPVFQVGQDGDTGDVEISDIIFETKGPAPGAILIEWNIAGSSPGSAGMWDVHTRIGGSAGTGLQSDTCSKNPSVQAPANPKCEGAFMLVHITAKASVYLENNWFWVADHELDMADHNQINIFNGRGVLIEATNGVWMYGTSAEHSQMYNYQLVNAKNVYMGAIQTETPYWESNPDATGPFKANSNYNDPDFSSCTSASCKKAWGLRSVSSSDVFIYGAGLYSFFENYSQDCIQTNSCQDNMVSIEKSGSNNWLYTLTTIGTKNMVTQDGQASVPQQGNQDVFGSTVAVVSA